MNHDVQALAAMTRPPRYIDDVCWSDWASLWNESSIELVHSPDKSPLPPLVPMKGQPPREALIKALVDADLHALRAELALDSSGINDPLPRERGSLGRTLLHFAAKFHGEAAKGDSREDMLRRLAFEHITSALLEAGADPLKVDDYGLWPWTYSHGRSPACLRDRSHRAASEGHFKSEHAIFNMPKKKPQA